MATGRPDVLFANFYDGTLTFIRLLPQYSTDHDHQPADESNRIRGWHCELLGDGHRLTHVALSMVWTGNQPHCRGDQPTLTLSNVQPSNAGSYFVLVTNLFGFAQSSNAVLTVSGGA